MAGIIVLALLMAGAALWCFFAPPEMLGTRRWQWQNGNTLRVTDEYVRQTRWLGVVYVVLFVAIVVGAIMLSLYSASAARFDAAWTRPEAVRPDADKDVLRGVPVVETTEAVRSFGADGLLDAQAYAVVGSQEHGPATDVKGSHDGDLVLQIATYQCDPVEIAIAQDAEMVRVTVVGIPTQEWRDTQRVLAEYDMNLHGSCNESERSVATGDRRHALLHVPLADPLGDRTLVDGATGDAVPIVPLAPKE